MRALVSPTHSDFESLTIARLPCQMPSHEMTLILKDQPSIKGVRFRCPKSSAGYDHEHDTLNDRIRWRMRLGWIRLRNSQISVYCGKMGSATRWGMCDEGVLIPLRH